MSERSEIRESIEAQKATIAEVERQIPELTADAMMDDGRIDDDEQKEIDDLGAFLQHAKNKLQSLIDEYNAVDREDQITGPGQIQDFGGLEAVGPAAVLDAESFMTGIVAHLNFSYEVKKGSSRIAHGNFRTGGLVNLELVRGEEYSVKMSGSAMVTDANVIMNDTQNGLIISCEWVVKPPLKDGAAHDPAVEILGRPSLRPTSSIFYPDKTDWSIIVKDISVSQTDVSQTGIHVQFTLNGSSGDGGSISAGGFDVSSSNSVSTTTSASLSSVLRFSFVEL